MGGPRPADNDFQRRRPTSSAHDPRVTHLHSARPRSSRRGRARSLPPLAWRCIGRSERYGKASNNRLYWHIALPLCSAALWSDGLDRRDFWWLTVMGRLKRDWTIPRANEYLRALSPGLLDATVPSGYSADLTAHYRAFRFGVIPAGRGVSRLRGAYGTSLSLLFGLTGLVLLMTCANLATLTLARASAREQLQRQSILGRRRYDQGILRDRFCQPYPQYRRQRQHAGRGLRRH